MKLPKRLRNFRQYLSAAIIDRENRLYPEILENDHQKIMVLGAVWCPFDKTRETGRYYEKENKYPELSDLKLDKNEIWSEVKIYEGGK